MALWGSHEFLVGATRRPRRPRRPGPFARVAGHPLAPAVPSGDAVRAIVAPKDSFGASSGEKELLKNPTVGQKS